ncbi:hypothetical protein EZ313_01350 [Ramlibacter henchirensis]|uniref:DUF4175 domain-containing protein n=1 Tax=Ramlibacter henchirensis TaxID=204072 RepID=A0A4Z0C5G4_9BURK|nr:hypothetical protein [Ramlibacter henchirensis]TFZ05349.1 hypothetical protein EZ313_01350 [Ramlibacter henchirensis]
MGPLDSLTHLAGFLAPAAFLALVLPAASRLLLRRGAGGYWLQAALVFIAAAAVLAGGLWWFGRDGKMATYAALALAAATAQWLAARAWK